MITLRDYQVKAKQRIYSSIKSGNKKIIVQAPTGAGKTIVAVSIIKDIQSKGLGAIFVVPMITLANQTYEELKKFGIKKAETLE